MASQRNASGSHSSASGRGVRGRLALAAAALAGLAVSAPAATLNDTYTGPVTGDYNNPAYWSLGFVPNNGNNGNNYNVVIDGNTGQNSVVQSNISPTINTLTVNAGDALQVGGNNTFTIAGPTVVDNGNIVVNYNQFYTGVLAFAANTTVSGTGSITLDSGGNAAQLTTGSGDELTQAAGHTINGYGAINATLANQGTVNANSSGNTLYLYSATADATGFSVTNTGTLKATTGTLQINGPTLNNAGGTILAAGGAVQIYGSSITGGTLSSNGAGAITFQNSTLAGAATITAGTTVDVDGNTNLTLTGPTLTNNGHLVLNENQSYSSTLQVNANTMLAGTGTLTLDSGGNAAQVATGMGDELTQAATHTIDGYGQINATTVNHGTVNADVAGQTFTIASATADASGFSFTNTGTLKATTGTLQVNGPTLNNATGTILAAGGAVQIYNATVTGGTLSSTGAGTISFENSTLAGTPTITVGTTVNLDGNTNLSVTAPTLTNNGTLVVNDNQYYGSTLTFNANTAITGTGTINLDSNGTNAQLNTGSGNTLTLGSGQTVVGYGQVNAAVTNNGTINANVTNTSGQALTLAGNGITNNNVLEATNGGTLYANGLTITQAAGGVIQAVGGSGGASPTASLVNLNGATISGGTLTATGAGSFTATNDTFTGGLTISAGTTVNVNGNSNLTVTGSTLTDNGHIVLNNNQYYSSALIFNANTTLAGNGTLTLDNNGNNAQVTTGTGFTLTQAAGHVIEGYGQINGTFVNNGTVNANVTGQPLTLAATITNNNTLESNNGGTLSAVGLTITQGTNGVIEAVGASGGATPTASTVNLNGATIIGGALAGAGAGYVTADNAAFTGGLTIFNGTLVNVDGNTDLTVTGATLTDNGHIVLNDNQYYGSTIHFNDNTTLAGTGTLTLDSTGNNAQVATGSNASGGVYTLTQAATHTINGYGQINAQFVNNGTVNANVAGQSITLAGYNQANNGVVKATVGGSVVVSGITLTQGASGILEALGTNAAGTTPSTLSISNSTVSGGTLATTGAAYATADDSTFTGGLTISTGSTVNVDGNNNLTVTGATLTDNGHIFLNENQYYSSTFQVNSNLTLAGTGTLTLDTGGNNAQVATGTGDTLTQGPSHTIDGIGQVNATLVNNGTVEADVNGQALTVNGPTTNNGQFLATLGGTLNVTAGVLSNLVGTTLTGGSYEADSNSTLNIPGTVTTNAATVSLVGATSTFAAINSLATNSGSFTLLLGRAYSTAGSLANSGSVTIGFGGTAPVTPVASLTVNGNYTQSAGITSAGGTLAVTGTTTINGGSLLFNPTEGTGVLVRPLGPLAIGSGGTVTVASAPTHATRSLLAVTGLSFAGTTAAPAGKLDLANNDLDVAGGSLAQVNAAVAAGYAGGKWNGAGGIVSSAAAADTRHLTALGVIQNNLGAGGTAGFTTFDGHAVTAADVLVKYTYYGDANLDGVVNGADYSRIDAGFIGHLTGWANGDFNYDGKVDGSDYTLTDNAFNQQPSSLGGSAVTALAATDLVATDLVATDLVATPTADLAPAAVPEPTAIGLLAVAAASLGLRRRRRA